MTTSQLTETNAHTHRVWGFPTVETAALSTATDVVTPMPDCDWEWKFSTIVDSICADYRDLPSFMSLSWN